MTSKSSVKSGLNKVLPARQEHPDSLALKVWNLDWKQILPRQLTETIRIESVAYAQAMPIVERLAVEAFQLDESESRFSEDASKENRQRYYENAGDYFIFYDSSQGDAVAGVAVCTLLDWSSYNLRHISMRPDYRGRGAYLEFLEMLAEVLPQYGVTRLEGTVSPTNRRHLEILNRFGFMVTSTIFSDRWGALLHMTKYFREVEEERFGQLFSLSHKNDNATNKKPMKKRAS